MLTELRIANLGVIEQLQIDIGAGLTTLTGETGTGKTVLLGAISLLVGGRAEADLVRPGALEARVDGRFWLPVSAVPPDVNDARPAAESADPAEIVEVVISRVVPRSGRSRAYVNGHPVTVATLAQMTSGHVDLHGQHAHQSLLSTQTQRAALDQFGAIDTGTLAALRARLVASEARRTELGGDERARAREIDLLSFQISEIDEAQISDPSEPENLAVEEETLADARGHLEAGADALERLTGEGAARDLLADMARTLSDRRPFHVASSRLGDLLAELDDLGAELRTVTEAIEENPERMEQIRLRRQALRDLCRKYGDDLCEVSRYREEAVDRLRLLSDHEAQAELIDAEIAQQQELLRQESARVRRDRVEAAPHLAAAVEQGLRSLAMPHARVEIRIAPPEVDPAGDRVEFMLAANPGLESAPLHKVASGGELSRAMLALRLALHASPAVNDPAAALFDVFSQSTLIFDEVDAGIGGAAAVSVADALGRLGTQHQVLVVTHLAQVAAVADQHLRVTKSSTDNSTVAEVEPVKGQDRVTEIARMLSGHHTAAAVRHAKELLSVRSAGFSAIHPATTSTGLG